MQPSLSRARAHDLRVVLSASSAAGGTDGRRAECCCIIPGSIPGSPAVALCGVGESGAACAASKFNVVNLVALDIRTISLHCSLTASVPRLNTVQL